jgi:hypothetical protein
MRLSLLLAPFWFVACASGNSSSKVDATDTDADTDTDVEIGRGTIEGEITWAVDFGSASEADGLTDCAYTRHYVGTQDLSAPWLCESCETVFVADVEVIDGREDCYDRISTLAPLDVEYLGYGGGAWYRGAGSGLTERGPATVDGTTLTVEQIVPDTESGGDYSFEIAGSLTLGTDAGDPYHGYFPPDTYACGWPKADPEPYTGGYAVELGKTVPDGVFHDVCEEPVRIHDFAGSYLIIDISAMDCPPCQTAARTEEAFVATMEAQGIDLHVVTLLAPSLSDTAGTPTTRELQSWINEYSLTSPVLADRVWGLSVVAAQIPNDFGYPTFVVVSPELEVLDISAGFSTWDSMGSTIRADAGM